ncbi:hypothetical protein CRYUN_Cryun07bG0135700 [Craigia yunnanensis]
MELTAIAKPCNLGDKSTSDVILRLSKVKSAIGILQLAVAFHCEDITNCCIQYLEAIPWEDKEEQQIVKAVSKLGPIAMPILARIQLVDLSATKNVFVSAIRFSTSIGGSCPPFGDELKTSAQQQVEFMLGGDEDTSLVTVDDEVKSVVKWVFPKVVHPLKRNCLPCLLFRTSLPRP